MITWLANPERFVKFARPAAPIAAIITVLTFIIGIPWALVFSPEDFRQGASVRIMYVHVPAAWMAMFVYTIIAVAGFISFVWRHVLADAAIRYAAPMGAIFTALALVTGSLWGQPMWGTWWAWDARLTSVLVLFFLYLGLISLRGAIGNETRAARLVAIAAMVGWINVPIVKFSVDIWNSLHQSASVIRADGPTIHASMLWPLAIMGLAYMAFFAWAMLTALSAEVDVRRAKALDSKTAPASRIRIETNASAGGALEPGAAHG